MGFHIVRFDDRFAIADDVRVSYSSGHNGYNVRKPVAFVVVVPDNDWLYFNVASERLAGFFTIGDVELVLHAL